MQIIIFDAIIPDAIIPDAIILDAIILDAIILDDKYLMQSYLGKGKRLAGKSDIACFGIDASFGVCKSNRLKYNAAFGIALKYINSVKARN